MKKVTEEWIEEKARKIVYYLFDDPAGYQGKEDYPDAVKYAKDFIRSLIEEIQGEQIERNKE